MAIDKALFPCRAYVGHKVVFHESTRVSAVHSFKICKVYDRHHLAREKEMTFSSFLLNVWWARFYFCEAAELASEDNFRGTERFFFSLSLCACVWRSLIIGPVFLLPFLFLKWQTTLHQNHFLSSKSSRSLFASVLYEMKFNMNEEICFQTKWEK